MIEWVIFNPMYMSNNKIEHTCVRLVKTIAKKLYIDIHKIIFIQKYNIIFFILPLYFISNTIFCIINTFILYKRVLNLYQKF